MRAFTPSEPRFLSPEQWGQLQHPARGARGLRLMMPPHTAWHTAGTWCMRTADGMPISALLVVGQWLGPWGVLPVSLGDPASSRPLCSLVAIRRPELGLWKQQGPNRPLPRVPLGNGRCGRLASSSRLPCHWKLASLPGGRWRLSFLNCSLLESRFLGAGGGS